MREYSIELVLTEGLKGLPKGAAFGIDGLSFDEMTKYLDGYVTYKGRIRVWKGITLIKEYNIA